ncbi:MgtC/SapB family protein [Sphingomonas oryzagri]
MIGTAEWEAMLLRLGVATVVGFLLGLEREWRGHPAGSRTHGLVALSSAMITISSLLLLDDLRGSGGTGDPLRVVQGLAQAIGFIAGGLIFVRGGTVKNMTTAASLWMAAAVGIGAGAGQFVLIGLATLIAAILLFADPLVKRWLPARPHHDEDGDAATMPNRRGATRVELPPQAK